MARSRPDGGTTRTPPSSGGGDWATTPAPAPAAKKAAPVKKAPGKKAPAKRGGRAAAPSTTAPTASAPAAAPSTSVEVNPGDVDAQIRKTFGYESWMLDIPELRDILVRAVTPGSDIYGGDDATIQGALTATPWWKQHSVTQRTWTETKSNDPASAAQKIEAQKAAILVTARQSGVNIPPARLAQMAEDALSNGWTNPQLQAAIGAEFHYDPKSTTGNAAGFAQEFKRMAHDYLVPISDQAMGQWVTQAVSGTVDADSFRSYLQESAKSMFPGLASAIDSGVTVTQFADPYKQLAAKDFGVPPESIDLGENKWMKFLNQVDAKTGARTSLSIADAQQSWRSDPAYGFQYTKVAKDDAYALANTITNEMGVRK